MENNNNNNNNNNNESKIRKIILNEVTFGIAMVAAIVSVVLFISGPDAQLQQDVALIQQDIEVIRTNELVHIQVGINENKERGVSNEETINEINLKLERIITLLEK